MAKRMALMVGPGLVLTAWLSGMAAASPISQPISAGEAFAQLYGKTERVELAQAPVPNFGRPPAPAPQQPGSLFPGQQPRLFGDQMQVASVPLARRELINRLRQNVVIVVAQNKQTRGWSIGTGFFFSATHLLTNTHVVENADDAFIANRTIGVRAAKVSFRGMARNNVGAGSASVGIDTAIIEALNFRSPNVLAFANSLEEGEQVAIAGFPGIALDVDKAYKDFGALIANGRIPTEDAIPSARFDFGHVFAIYNHNETGVENFQSGGFGAKGNSGSPLINACGQVVGQIYRGPVARLSVFQNGREQVAVGETVNYNENLSFRALVKFLRAAGVPFNQANDACMGDIR